MKLLTFSSLFPNPQNPGHGIFVQTRLRQLLTTPNIESHVVAPVPWFPFRHNIFGKYANFARIPEKEIRDGIQVSHPRYLSIPKVGMTVAPQLMAEAMKPVLRRIIDEGYDFDLIDAHYFYPDGVAAVKLGRYFNKPVVITARGSDINLITNYAMPRKSVCWAANQADGIITVCEALKIKLVNLGIEPESITTLRNGVDLNLFHPVDRQKQRSVMNMNSFTVLSVGQLNKNKSHDIAISALTQLTDTSLIIAGAGPERKNLEMLVHTLKVGERVKFLGALSQADLIPYFGAADVLVLSSSREGWANVLLEAMACGTPVIASNVGGSPEVVTSKDAGLIMKERTTNGLIEAISTLRNNYPNHEATRAYAEKFSWEATTNGQIEMFRKILSDRRKTDYVGVPSGC